jgi:hypothetical protein
MSYMFRLSQLVLVEFSIDIKSFRSHYGPAVDSASNRNEHQEYFLGVKAADNLPPPYAVVAKSGNLNFLEPFGPVQACNGTALPLHVSTINSHLQAHSLSFKSQDAMHTLGSYRVYIHGIHKM